MKATLAEIINVVEIIIVLLVVSTVIRMGINYFTTGQILWGYYLKLFTKETISVVIFFGLIELIQICLSI